MRIAWIGPMPNGQGGASGVSALLLRELEKHRVEVDCYVPGPAENLPDNLINLKHIHFFNETSKWQWGRWYSRNRLMSFITGQFSNLRCENRLAKALVRAHRKCPYDVVYQFSHIEFSALRNYKRELPPIVLHPSVHAMGELRWHRSEKHLAKSCEPLALRFGSRLLLISRSLVQKRHIRLADRVLALSNHFAKELVEDYGYPKHKIAVVPNPIDLERFVPDIPAKQAQPRFILLFVSRIAVRKGVEMIVELSRRLDDLAGRVEIQIVGNKSLWSDYTPLLKQLNPRTAKYVGQIHGDGLAMTRLYQKAHMLIQPSRYEPFGLTVGEALACGTPVVASDRVGAAENADRSVCRIFPGGDVNALERQVRALLSDLRDEEKAQRLFGKCRKECERLYDGQLVASSLLANLRQEASPACAAAAKRKMPISL